MPGPSDPLATAAELDTYLQLGGRVDTDRADMLITMAQELAEAEISPLPAAAKSVILSAAARAYTNPAGVTYETIGPFSAQRPAAGVYLTRAELNTLRRLAGRSGAYTIDPTPAGAGQNYPDPAWLL